MPGGASAVCCRLRFMRPPVLSAALPSDVSPPVLAGFEPAAASTRRVVRSCAEPRPLRGARCLAGAAPLCSLLSLASSSLSSSSSSSWPQKSCQQNWLFTRYTHQAAQARRNCVSSDNTFVVLTLKTENTSRSPRLRMAYHRARETRAADGPTCPFDASSLSVGRYSASPPLSSSSSSS